jgi:transcription elongation factor Elf1
MRLEESIMKDIKLLEICDNCGQHLTLMESQRVEDGTVWAVKRCLNCGGFPAEEITRLHTDIEEAICKKQQPIKVAHEYDDEFTCPTCGETTEDYDVTTFEFCPKCGQKLAW